MPLPYTHCDPLAAPLPTGKNVRRSIQGVGHMMSTMVLNRKQSVFGGPSLPASAGAPEPLDRSRFEENEDIVVMETKLKILEILQVAGALGRGRGGGRSEWAGGVSPLKAQPVVLGGSTRSHLAQGFSKCGLLAGSISLTRGLRNAGSWALPEIYG